MQVMISVTRGHPVSAVHHRSGRPEKGNSEQREAFQRLSIWLADAQRLKKGVFVVTTCRSLEMYTPRDLHLGVGYNVD
jgi:hypothetical protein